MNTDKAVDEVIRELERRSKDLRVALGRVVSALGVLRGREVAVCPTCGGSGMTGTRRAKAAKKKRSLRKRVTARQVRDVVMWLEQANPGELFTYDAVEKRLGVAGSNHTVRKEIQAMVKRGSLELDTTRRWPRYRYVKPRSTVEPMTPLDLPTRRSNPVAGTGASSTRNKEFDTLLATVRTQVGPENVKRTGKGHFQVKGPGGTFTVAASNSKRGIKNAQSQLRRIGVAT